MKVIGVQQVILVAQVHKDRPVLLVVKVIGVLRVLPVAQVHRVRLVLLVQQVHKALLVLLVARVTGVQQVIQVLLDKDLTFLENGRILQLNISHMML